MVCARLLVPTELEPIRLLVDRRFKNEIAIREQAMADSVERVRKTPGDVLCPALISYRAGKPFVIDKFYAKQRMSAGAFRDAVTARVAARTLTIVKTDRRARWTKPFRINPVPPAELKKWDVWVGDWTLSGIAKDTLTGPGEGELYLHEHVLLTNSSCKSIKVKGNGPELKNMIFSTIRLRRFIMLPHSPVTESREIIATFSDTATETAGAGSQPWIHETP